MGSRADSQPVVPHEAGAGAPCVVHFAPRQNATKECFPVKLDCLTCCASPPPFPPNTHLCVFYCAPTRAYQHLAAPFELVRARCLGEPAVRTVNEVVRVQRLLARALRR
eukprot:2526079-Pleurochrysis_carterae.AAC.7